MSKPKEELKSPEMTLDEIRNAEEKVLFPDLMKVEIVFMGKNVSVVPLPIKICKELYAKCKPLTDTCSKYAPDLTGNSKNLNLPGSVDLEELSNLELRVADALVDITILLSHHYNLDLSEEIIRETASLVDVENFVNSQLSVNKESDFLLRPLGIIMKALIILPALSGMPQTRPV